MLSFTVFMFIVLATCALGAGTYVGLKKKNLLINGEWINLRGLLRKRRELVPLFIKTVRGFRQDIEGLLTEAADLAAAAGDARDMEDLAEKESQLAVTLSAIFVINESFEELIDNADYSDLVFNLAEADRQIQASCDFYNGIVDEFNSMIKIFPVNLIAEKLSLGSRELFNYEGRAYGDEEEEPEDTGIYDDETS